MSGGGGGGIIRKKIQAALATESVLTQLGPNKRARAEVLVATDSDSWEHSDTHFALRCIRDACEAYE